MKRACSGLGAESERKRCVRLRIGGGPQPRKFICKQEAEAPGGQWHLAVLFR